jgi:hypothetical protein
MQSTAIALRWQRGGLAAGGRGARPAGACRPWRGAAAQPQRRATASSGCACVGGRPGQLGCTGVPRPCRRAALCHIDYLLRGCGVAAVSVLCGGMPVVCKCCFRIGVSFVTVPWARCAGCGACVTPALFAAVAESGEPGACLGVRVPSSCVCVVLLCACVAWNPVGGLERRVPLIQKPCLLIRCNHCWVLKWCTDLELSARCQRPSGAALPACTSLRAQSSSPGPAGRCRLEAYTKSEANVS